MSCLPTCPCPHHQQTELLAVCQTGSDPDLSLSLSLHTEQLGHACEGNTGTKPVWGVVDSEDVNSKTLVGR